MSVRFGMTDRSSFTLPEETIQTFELMWVKALRRERQLEVANSRGLRRWINPEQIVYAEELDDA